MNIFNYKFYEIDSNEPFMSCKNIFIHKKNNHIYINCINIDCIDMNNNFKKKFFIKNINFPYSDKIFIEAINFNFYNNVLIIKSNLKDDYCFIIDEFTTNMSYLNKNEKIWLNKKDDWKLFYLFSVYSLFGYVKTNKKEIIINGKNIKSEIDFFCEVGFSINNSWGYIGNNFYNISEFLFSLPKDACFIWNDFNTSERYLRNKSTSGYSTLENIIMRIDEQYRVIFK